MWCRKARSISWRATAADGRGRRGPGALIGEVALISETRRPVSAVAREPSSVVRIPRQLFLKMLESDPDAATRMRDALAARVNQTANEFARVRAGLAGGPRAQVSAAIDGRAAPSGAENPGRTNSAR